MSETSYPVARARATSGVAYYLRVLRVVGALDFKAKYTDAALGYVWSLVKPLAYFGVLWLVFAHLLQTANQTEDFTLFLLIGILLFLFFIDAVTAMLPSIVEGGATLRRLAFPPIMIPLSASVAIGITFCVNVSAFAVFAAIQRGRATDRVAARPPAARRAVPLHGRPRLAAQRALRPASATSARSGSSRRSSSSSPRAIFYPIGILPDWAQKVAFLNPFVQVMQDIRHVVLGGASGPYDLTAADVFAGAGRTTHPDPHRRARLRRRLSLFFRREGRYFAERL